MMTTTLQLYDFLMLLQLELWQGGRVERLGYLCKAQALGATENGQERYGYALSYDAVMVDAKNNENGTLAMTLALYKPYEEKWMSFQLATEISSREELMHQLMYLVEGQLKRLDQPIEFKRRWTSTHSSMRSGGISTTRRNR